MQTSSHSLNIKSEFNPSQNGGYSTSQGGGQYSAGNAGYFGGTDGPQSSHYGSQDVGHFGWQQESQPFSPTNMNSGKSTPWKPRATQNKSTAGNRGGGTNKQSQAKAAIKIETPGQSGNNSNMQYYLADRARTKSRKPSQLFGCDYCGKMFTTASGLYFHKPIHTGEWKLKCNICDRGYMEQSKYDKHIASHRKQFNAM